MRKLFRLPFISLPMKFMARVTFAAIWGVALSPFDLDVRIIFAVLMGLLGLACSTAFFGWDKQPLSASRFALYGLYVAGEVLAIGCFVFAFLGTFQGPLNVWAMVLCGFGGSLLTAYPLAYLYKDNMSRGPGSNA